MRFIFYPAWRFPTWFRWRKSGRRAESASGGDGLLANPRSRPTPLSGVRTSTSESVRWLLLLFSIEKQRKEKSFSESRKRTSRGFLLLLATEKQRKKFFGTECSRDFRKVTPGRRVFTVCSNLKPGVHSMFQPKTTRYENQNTPPVVAAAFLRLRCSCVARDFPGRLERDSLHCQKGPRTGS